MRPVSVRIMHPEPGPTAGPLERWVADARSAIARNHVAGFTAAGADDVGIVGGPPDDLPFGARLRSLVGADGPAGRLRAAIPAGLVVLGSGAIPLATAADRRAFVTAAADEEPRVLANNRYSADVVAISRLDRLPAVPDLPGDNALPRWLEEVAGRGVVDLRRRWRLAFDVDGPLDLLLLGWTAAAPTGIDLATSRLADIRAVAADRRAELVVAGRTSAASLAWLEGHAAARVRAWVEERGLRAASRMAQGIDATRRESRRPRSVLGELLERDGPRSLGDHLARFGEGAIVDSRVLLAHRLGADEAAWPVAEDRFASDLLLADRVADPWLRDLTATAATARIPILLGGHTLVGPGVRLVVDGPPRRPRWT